MVYSGLRLTDRGLAWSDDGMTWRRDGDVPVITAESFPIEGKAWDAALIDRDGTLYYYLEIGSATGTNGTQVYLATRADPVSSETGRTPCSVVSTFDRTGSNPYRTRAGWSSGSSSGS